jgi:putative flippase GtrA
MINLGIGPVARRFAFVGAINTIVGLSAFPLFFLFLENSGVHYLSVLVLSQVCCVVFAFCMNKLFVFRSTDGGVAEFFRFSSFYAIHAAANFVLLPLLVEVFRAPPVVAQTGLAFGLIVTSFFWHRFISFRNSTK